MAWNIVIPLDGSEFAAAALPVGVGLATEGDGTIRVLGIAASDAEYDWTFDHVHDDVKRAGLDPGGIEIFVDPRPVQVLLELAAEAGNVLCLASHDHEHASAKLRHSVGSEVIEQATHPLVVVGPNTAKAMPGRDVVVAIDGVDDPEPLVAVAASWALRLHARLRIVTVYEPVPADVRRPDHFTRHHGPPGDPEVFLAAVRERVSDIGLAGVDVAAVADPVSVAAGLEHHVEAAPARLVVIGGGKPRATLSEGLARHLLTTASAPLLIVNRSER